MHGHDTSSKASLHATYKPFLHVLDPETESPITKGPGGQFTHHRGIYVGWNRLTTAEGRYDFWHMNQCVQVHRSFAKTSVSEDQALFTSAIDWVHGQEETVIHEARQMTFAPLDAPRGMILIDLNTRLVPTEDLKLNGDPEHAGVQFRPANEVDARKTKYLFPKEGQDPRKDFDLPWVAEQFSLGDQVYSVVHMNHPDNPKPTRYSAYRDYGRFGAFFTRSLNKSEPLELAYRFAVFRGALPSREDIASLYQDWVQP